LPVFVIVQLYFELFRQCGIPPIILYTSCVSGLWSIPIKSGLKKMR